MTWPSTSDAYQQIAVDRRSERRRRHRLAPDHLTIRGADGHEIAAGGGDHPACVRDGRRGHAAARRARATRRRPSAAFNAWIASPAAT